jgi:hypothetical protein
MPLLRRGTKSEQTTRYAPKRRRQLAGLTALPQMLARAMTRKGNALHKMGNLEGAIDAYSKVRQSDSFAPVSLLTLHASR